MTPRRIENVTTTSSDIMQHMDTPKWYLILFPRKVPEVETPAVVPAELPAAAANSTADTCQSSDQGLPSFCSRRRLCPYFWPANPFTPQLGAQTVSGFGKEEFKGVCGRAVLVPFSHQLTALSRLLSSMEAGPRSILNGPPVVEVPGRSSTPDQSDGLV